MKKYLYTGVMMVLAFIASAYATQKVMAVYTATGCVHKCSWWDQVIVTIYFNDQGQYIGGSSYCANGSNNYFYQGQSCAGSTLITYANNGVILDPGNKQCAGQGFTATSCVHHCNYSCSSGDGPVNVTFHLDSLGYRQYVSCNNCGGGCGVFSVSDAGEGCLGTTRIYYANNGWIFSDNNPRCAYNKVDTAVCDAGYVGRCSVGTAESLSSNSSEYLWACRGGHPGSAIWRGWNTPNIPAGVNRTVQLCSDSGCWTVEDVGVYKSTSAPTSCTVNRSDFDGGCSTEYQQCTSGWAMATSFDTTGNATYSYWTCPGRNGGTDTRCSIMKVNGDRGTEAGTCKYTAATNVIQTDTTITWTCPGLYGGESKTYTDTINKPTLDSDKTQVNAGGDSATINYDLNGYDRNSCTLTGPDGNIALTGNIGSLTVTVNQTSTYTLTCGGVSTQITIRVPGAVTEQ